MTTFLYLGELILLPVSFILIGLIQMLKQTLSYDGTTGNINVAVVPFYTNHAHSVVLIPKPFPGLAYAVGLVAVSIVIRNSFVLGNKGLSETHRQAEPCLTVINVRSESTQNIQGTSILLSSTIRQVCLCGVMINNDALNVGEIQGLALC